MTVKNISAETLTEARRLISVLPQAARIDPARIDWWLDEVLMKEPGRLLWHVQRLRGIGASESGGMVLWARGEYSMSSARDLVASKLLMQAPEGENGNTRRGIRLEPVIREMFFEKFHGARRREDIAQAMLRVTDPEHPWVVGNPDDVFEMGGGIFVVDHKSPNPDTFDSLQSAGGIKFEYAVQLHQLRRIANLALKQMGDERQVSGLILSQLDYNSFDIDAQEIDYDPELEAELLSVGDMIWRDHVCAGLLPAALSKPVIDPAELPKDLAAVLPLAASEFLATNYLAAQLKEMADGVRKDIAASIGDFAIRDRVIAMGGIRVSERRVINPEQLRTACERAGEPVPEGVPDAKELKALVARLAAAGESEDALFDTSIDVRASMAKSGQEFEIREAFKADAAASANRITEEIRASVVAAHAPSARPAPRP